MGELCDLVEPTLIEALAGIKIIEVAAGGWHSCALSDHGDLYVWGWNNHGQLGIPLKLKKTIYALPEIVDVCESGSDDDDDPAEINLIDCGSSHTIICSKSGKLFGTGATNFGQLAEVSSRSGFVDQFQTISCPVTRVEKIICEFSSSFIFSSVPRECQQSRTSENGSSAVL